MLLIVGTIRLPAAKLDRARPVMQRMVEASRAEAGCLDYFYAQDIADPGLIHVRELWTDRTALDAHFASAHLVEWRSRWSDLGIGERDLRMFEVGEAEAT